MTTANKAFIIALIVVEMRPERSGGRIATMKTQADLLEIIFLKKLILIKLQNNT